MRNAAERIGLMEDEAIVLDEAALALSALDHPGLDITSFAECLSGLAAKLLNSSQSSANAYARAQALADLLAGEEGFSGDSETYDHPANSDFVSMLRRRRGLPVTLSVLYIGLARKVGWHADALNSPNHLLIRIGREPASVVQDPFGDGEVLTDRRLAEVIGMRGAKIDSSHLAPLSNRSVLLRLLNNPAARAVRDGDYERALTLYRRMTDLAPAFTGLWWERARLEKKVGADSAARASLYAMLETTRDRTLRRRAKLMLKTMSSSAI